MSFIWLNRSSSRRPKATPKSIALDNINVAAPCPANWEDMTGDDRVRHCSECNLNVYNLSEMTKLEAEGLIASREGRLCVRFFRRADGTILTRNCPRGLRAATDRISRITAVVLSAMMAATPGFGQSPSTNSQAQSESKSGQFGLDVTVVDPTNAVIPNAQIVVCRCKDKFSFKTSSDAAGTASFRGLAKGTYEIDVSARGFKPVRQALTLGKIEQLQVKLPIGAMSTTVEVTSTTGAIEMGTTMGMVSIIQSTIPLGAPQPGRPAPIR